jgi:hypothetical protein
MNSSIISISIVSIVPGAHEKEESSLELTFYKMAGTWKALSSTLLL